MIIQEAQTIKSLVDEFSDFARLPKINLQPADLGDILHQVVALFRGIFADIAFDVRVAPDVPAEIRLDAEQIKRVFINLIDNAIDAMNKKGTIPLPRPPSTIGAKGPGRGLRHRAGASRRGPGQDLPAHFSTKKKGTGLGLAIVSQIVREHDGPVRVENNRPNGAKFIIELPA